MGSRTTNFCDCCGEEEREGKPLHRIPHTADLCKGCVVAILCAAWGDGTVAGKTLRPFCQDCKGKGAVKENHSSHHYDRDWVTVKCKNCIP